MYGYDSSNRCCEGVYGYGPVGQVDHPLVV